MKEVLETIVRNLVDDKDSVSVIKEETEKQINFKVSVSQADMGKVIGKQGRVAKAIRTVIKSLAAKEHKKVNVEFAE